MFDRLKSEALFLEHLAWIDKVARRTCRTRGILGDDAEDFAAWIQTELIRDDYAVFRRYRGESTLATYLATVVVRRFHDYLRERLGRWRPSAMAQRMGPPANELEALVHRDGYTVAQAGEKLRTAGRTNLSDTELARLLECLPARTPLRPVEVTSDMALDSAADPSRADGAMDAADEAERHDRVMAALRGAMEQLGAEDQLIVRMHYQDGFTLADVARALGIEQKPLYRRIERLQKRLRAALEDAGVDSARVLEMLEGGEGK